MQINDKQSILNNCLQKSYEILNEKENTSVTLNFNEITVDISKINYLKIRIQTNFIKICNNQINNFIMLKLNNKKFYILNEKKLVDYNFINNQLKQNNYVSFQDSEGMGGIELKIENNELYGKVGMTNGFSLNQHNLKTLIENNINFDLDYIFNFFSNTNNFL